MNKDKRKGKFNKFIKNEDQSIKDVGFKKMKGFKGKKPFKGESTNDVSWHTKNREAVTDICSYPFNVMVGNGFQISENANEVRSFLSTGYAHLFSVDHDWMIDARSNDSKTSLNLAAANLYAFMRQHNSGSVNYERSDLFTSVMLGTIDILATIAYCDKMFGIVKTFSNKNRTLPRTLFQSMNIDYDDFVNNLSRYRSEFNVLLAKATSLVMPKEYPIVDQMIAIYRDIHVDVDHVTGREQIINIVKPCYHIYDATSDPNGGKVRLMDSVDILESGGTTDPLYLGVMEGLKQSTIGVDSYYTEQAVIPAGSANKLTQFSTLLTILNKQVDALILDDDFNTMAGDIMKAFDKYGQGEFWTFKPVERDYEMQISYSEEFLKQLHNATILPHAMGYGYRSGTDAMGNTHYLYTVEGYTNTIAQTQSNYGSMLRTTWSLTANIPDANAALMQTVHGFNMLIDSSNINPSPEEVLLITRWHSVYNVTVESPASGKSMVSFSPKAVSTMVFMNARIWYTEETNAKRNTGADNFTLREMQCPFLQCYSLNLRVNNPGWFCKDQINGIPITYVDFLGNATKAQNTELKIFVSGDLDNAVSIDTKTLARIHEADLASLLNIPFGKSF